MPTVSTPLRYPGGKTALTDFLIRTIELNRLAQCTYIEPFCGGAGAAINLLLKGYVRKIILNDVDPMIYSFWYSILNYTDKFIELIELADISVQEWQRQKRISLDKKSSILELGFSAFFLNRCNRSGILRANPIGGLKQKGRWDIRARFNKKTLIEKIIKISEYKKFIVVENRDIFSFLFDIAFPLKEKKFIYLDPPYYTKGQSLYINAFSPDDHENLSKILLKSKETLWIATYDDNPEINRMYSDASIKAFFLNYSAHSHKKGKEILIHPEQTLIDDMHPIIV